MEKQAHFLKWGNNFKSQLKDYKTQKQAIKFLSKLNSEEESLMIWIITILCLILWRDM